MLCMHNLLMTRDLRLEILDLCVSMCDQCACVIVIVIYAA